ncbi:hypothetical protein OsJ_28769 [Oryza sativa Japonica Group]|uniref:Uncharacterized protein n=1 Tax=Oryza sativa subsp. japonica TaxID=39947 RepID=A3BX55_ORYSJ|nr:hypothetical protein OsJ_28769 [Oryza sativa Japonica Group]
MAATIPRFPSTTPGSASTRWYSPNSPPLGFTRRISSTPGSSSTKAKVTPADVDVDDDDKDDIADVARINKLRVNVKELGVALKRKTK